jgi:hypothetical protein
MLKIMRNVAIRAQDLSCFQQMCDNGAVGANAIQSGLSKAQLSVVWRRSQTIKNKPPTNNYSANQFAIKRSSTHDLDGYNVGIRGRLTKKVVDVHETVVRVMEQLQNT